MSRLPELERELVAAARREFAAARRPRLRMPVSRLVPVAAALVVLVAVGLALRAQEREVEAPAGSFSGVASVLPEELRSGALGKAMAPGGTSPADFSVAPSAIRVEDSGAGEWRAVVYAGTDRGTVCFAAAVTGQSDEFPAGGTNCVAAAILGPELAPGGRGISLGQPSEARPPRFGSRIVYGLVGPEATAVEVTLGSATRPAVVDATVFQMTVGEAEREAIAKDGGTPPPAGEYGFRLFAAAFTEDEAPGDPLDFRVETKTTYADGTTATHTEPAVSRPPAESSPAGCYRTASTGSDVAVPGGSGTPLEICERFWRETGFEGTPRPERLVACHGSGSAPWVFPGGPGTCERLGLKPLVVAIIR